MFYLPRDSCDAFDTPRLPTSARPRDRREDERGLETEAPTVRCIGGILDRVADAGAELIAAPPSLTSFVIVRLIGTDASLSVQ